MSSFTQVMKQLIKDAVIKVSVENPALNREGEVSAEEARDMFIVALLAELFPEHGNEASASVEIPVAPEVVPVAPVPILPESPVVKKKLTKEEKAAEKEAEKARKAAEKARKEAEKEAEKAAKKAAADAEKAAKKAAKKSPPKSDLNVPKIDPTWRKLLKEADKEHAKELEPELLKYLNSIANAVFNDKPARQHVADFIASRAPPAAPAEPAAGPVDLEVVEFNGKEYYVNPETKRVYEGVTNADGELTITRPIGYVGMAEFKDMVLEDD